jgi:hypothetical protein
MECRSVVGQAVTAFTLVSSILAVRRGCRSNFDSDSIVTVAVALLVFKVGLVLDSTIVLASAYREYLLTAGRIRATVIEFNA